MKHLAVSFTILSALVTTTSAADAPKAELFGGFSYLRIEEADGVNAYGFNVSVAGSLNSWLSLVGDYSRHEEAFPVAVPGGSIDGRSQLFLGGPRVTLRAPRVQPFVHALFGAARFEVDALGFSVSDTAFATALGGGVDVEATDWLAIRLVQADYVLTRFGDDNQNNLRTSFGVVFRFGN